MANRMLPAIMFGVLSASSFALAAPFTRLAFIHGVMPVDAVAIRSLIAFVFLTGLIWFTSKSFNVPKKARGAIFGLGCSTTLLSVCYLSSVAFIPVGLAVIIFFTFPLLILLTSPIVEKTKFGFSRFLIGLVALAGLYLAVGPNSSLENLDWRGLVLAGFGAVGGVCQFYFARAATQKVDGPIIIWGAHLVIVPVTILISLLFGMDKFSPDNMGAVLVPGLMAAAVISFGYLSGFLFQIKAVSNAPASHVAPAYNIEPVISTTLAAVMFGERLANTQYAGGVLVLIALIFSNLISLRNK